jgi:spore coat polysaccharide biosynthesis predicted glycosyltransferase SpsG
LLEVRIDLEVRIVIGPLFKPEYEATLWAMIPGNRKNFQFVRHPSSLVEHMVWADVAVVTSGLIKYELAATGTPSITLSIDSYHDKVNKVFGSGGSIMDLGLDHSSTSIIRSVEHLVGDVDNRRRMSAAGRKLVDGLGAVRIARELATLIEVRRSAETPL